MEAKPETNAGPSRLAVGLVFFGLAMMPVGLIIIAVFERPLDSRESAIAAMGVIWLVWQCFLGAILVLGIQDRARRRRSSRDADRPASR